MMLRSKKAQSILEYTIIFAVIVAAIIFVSSIIQSKSKSLYGEQGAGKVIADATTEFADKNLVSSGGGGGDFPIIPNIPKPIPNIPNIPEPQE